MKERVKTLIAEYDSSQLSDRIEIIDQDQFHLRYRDTHHVFIPIKRGRKHIKPLFFILKYKEDINTFVWYHWNRRGTFKFLTPWINDIILMTSYDNIRQADPQDAYGEFDRDFNSVFDTTALFNPDISFLKIPRTGDFKVTEDTLERMLRKDHHIASTKRLVQEVIELLKFRL